MYLLTMSVNAKYHRYVTMIFQSTFKGHTDYIQCLGLKEKKNQFLSGSEDGTVRVWGKNSQIIRNLKLTLSRRGVGEEAESARADFKCRYLNNGYSYNSNISRLFLETQLQYGQKKW